jgi:hypothetical protein
MQSQRFFVDESRVSATTAIKLEEQLQQQPAPESTATTPSPASASAHICVFCEVDTMAEPCPLCQEGISSDSLVNFLSNEGRIADECVALPTNLLTNMSIPDGWAMQPSMDDLMLATPDLNYCIQSSNKFTQEEEEEESKAPSSPQGGSMHKKRKLTSEYRGVVSYTLILMMSDARLISLITHKPMVPVSTCSHPPKSL